MSVRQAPAGLSDTGLTPIDPLPHRADEEKSWPAEQLPLENSHRRTSRAPGDLPPSHHLPVLTPQGWPSLDQQQSPALQTTALPPGHALSRQGRSRAGAGQRRQASGHGGQGGGTTALESSDLRCERRRKCGSSRRCRSRGRRQTTASCGHPAPHPTAGRKRAEAKPRGGKSSRRASMSPRGHARVGAKEQEPPQEQRQEAPGRRDGEQPRQVPTSCPPAGVGKGLTSGQLRAEALGAQSLAGEGPGHRLLHGREGQGRGPRGRRPRARVQPVCAHLSLRSPRSRRQ